MTVTIDQTLFWTVLSALIAYDVFNIVLSKIIPRRSHCLSVYDQGFGPKGMVVKSRDNLGVKTPEVSDTPKQ